MKSDLIVALCFSTLAIALIILAILISKRGGRYTPPDAAQIEAMRSQNSHEHQASESMTRDIQGKVDKLHERFGFLSDPKKPEPPVHVKKDDTQ